MSYKSMTYVYVPSINWRTIRVYAECEIGVGYLLRSTNKLSLSGEKPFRGTTGGTGCSSIASDTSNNSAQKYDNWGCAYAGDVQIVGVSCGKVAIICLFLKKSVFFKEKVLTGEISVV